MAAGGDQAKQMKEFIKGVERSGYVVESDGLMYKIRDPETNGLIMTAAKFPKGQFVVKETIGKAKRAGIEIAEERQKRGSGASPPPVDSELPPHILRQQKEWEAEQSAREEAAVKEASEQVKQETAGIREDLSLILQTLGDTAANRMFIWEFGVQVAKDSGADYWLGKDANRPKNAAQQHISRILTGAMTALRKKDLDFWQNMLDEYYKQDATQKTEDTATQVEQNVSYEQLVEDLESERIQLEATRGLLAEARQELLDEKAAHRRTQADALNAQKSTSNGQATIDDLFLTVVKRMLAPKFPNDTDAIDEALDFAAEVARRTSA